MEDKILRFIELSEEFAKCPEEYSKFPTSGGYAYLNVTSTSNTTSFAYLPSQVKLEAKTKLERYKESLDEVLAKAERWEEYVSLQSDLKVFFKVKLKLDKNE